MSLSPNAFPFFSCPNLYSMHVRNCFLYNAQTTLSHFDFCLLCDIINEWESSPLLNDCLRIWESYKTTNTTSSVNNLQILSFNVRGFNLRYQEVLLLANSFKFDVLILLETGWFDLSFCNQVFSSYKSFFQCGENSNGGVVVLVRKDVKVQRVECDVPNVCIIDVLAEQSLRIMGIYAPESKSWRWDDLSPFISSNCFLFGDFNVDFDKDKTKAELLLNWADELSLSPFLPEKSTSLRSERIIDFVLSSGCSVCTQTYEGGTSSDHKPIMSIVPIKSNEILFARNIHWKVFTTFCDYVHNFWDKNWCVVDVNNTYNDYVSFLSLLEARCTQLFPLDKYRIALPGELRAFMALTRALSFRFKRVHDPHLLDIVKARRKLAKSELKNFLAGQLDRALDDRNSSSQLSISFWSRTKKFMRSASSSLHGFILPNGDVVKEEKRMCEVAVNYYEDFLSESDNIIRPHPYTDAPDFHWENFHELIPTTSVEEVLEIVRSRKKKKSCDAHGLSNRLISAIPINYWSLLVQVFNLSLTDGIFPDKWKDTRILLLAKIESVCDPSCTRPISLLDSFLKINEKIFLKRFSDVLKRRGILPDSQSGFREKFRLQTRVLLFFDQISSLMANSSPISTIFVDFKAAFDQLWFAGCVGKLKQLGIPKAYLTWIDTWLRNRRAFIEINGEKSRWFDIQKGCPQGSILSPTLFITYHSDMIDFLGVCLPHFFADDLAAIVAGSIGSKFTRQCLDLERKLRVFFDNLEFYATLTAQPINFSKTKALWSARAIGPPKVTIPVHANEITWEKQFKYLGYNLTPKLGFGMLINKCKLAVRQRVGMINRCRIGGSTSPRLRKTLFLSFILPLFPWIFPLYPLFTRHQQQDLNHFYYSCLKRVLHCPHWRDNFFAFACNELSLEDRCARYWDRYWESLSDSTDGFLLFEQANFNVSRENWVQGEGCIQGIFRSKRYKSCRSVLERCANWCANAASDDSIINYDLEEVLVLSFFPESFP